MSTLLLLFKILLLNPLFTFLLLLITFISYFLYLSKMRKSHISREESLSVLVCFYKISNLKSTLFHLLLYFSFTVILFLFVRLSNIGYNRALFSLSVPKISINLLLVMFIIISFLILLGFFRILFYPFILQEMFRLYLYLLTFNKGKSFIEFLFDCYHNTKGNDYIDKCDSFFCNIQPDREIPIFVLKEYNDSHLITIETIYSIRNTLKKKATLLAIVRVVSMLFFRIRQYWWALRYYSVYFILYCVILYDLNKEVMYYTYYILPIVMIITLYRNILSFIGTKDFYILDPILSAYIYIKGCSLETLYNNEANIREYLSNGYRGEHASYFFTEKTLVIDPTFTIVKRLYLLISICITSWILLFHTTLLNSLWLTLLLALSFNTIEVNPSIVAQSKKLLKRMAFNLSVTFMILINSWVYLTRHNHNAISEVIWNKGVIIKQTFTIEEKADFLYKYLNHTLDNLTDISEEVKGFILSKVTDEHLLHNLTNETTIQQIRDFVEQLPVVYFRLEMFYDKRFYEILSETRSLAQSEISYIMTEHWINIMAVLIIIIGLYKYYASNIS